MFVKVGYIGSRHSVRKIKKIARDLPQLKLNTYVYNKPEDIPELYEQAVTETDAICFSGIISSYYKGDEVKTDKPVIVTPFHEYMIITTIFIVVQNNDALLGEFSLDLPDEQLLDQVEADISYKIPRDLVYDYDWIYEAVPKRSLNFADIVTFHTDLYHAGKTKIALTSIHRVYDTLLSLGVPVLYMIDYDRNMKQALLDAKAAVFHSRVQDGMLVVLKIGLKNDQSMTTEEEMLIIESLKSVNKSLNFVMPETDSYLSFLTTRGIIESSLDTLKEGVWLNDLEASLGSQVVFSIGYGRYLFEAETNVNEALEVACKESNSNGYLLTEDKKLIGPLRGKITSGQMRIRSGFLSELTEQTQTSLHTMTRFMNFIHLHDYQPFTIRELSVYSDVTDRTTERFIKRLFDHEVVMIDGQEQVKGRGRPRNVYVLTEPYDQRFRRLNN